jgi:hypothetical protein
MEFVCPATIVVIKENQSLQGQTMKHKNNRVWLLLFLLSLSACGGEGESSLVGQWVAQDWGGGTSNWVDRVAGAIATVPGVSNSPTKTTIAGSSASALVFDGIDDFLSLDASKNPIVGKDSVTIVALFRTTQGASGVDGNFWNYPGPLNGEAPGGPNDWGLTYDAAGDAYGFFNEQISLLSSPTSLINGQVHTMILTWQDPSVYPDGGVANLYIDGVLVGSSIQSDDGSGIANSGFVIGGTSQLEAPSDYRYFNGEVIELRFYDAIMDPAGIHIQMLYTLNQG